jgi:threonine synthase
MALRTGLPVHRLVVATNRNDILHRFFSSGEYRPGAVQPTQSPSMDIQIASNFERFLFELCDRDGAEVARLMGALRDQGGFRIEDDERLARARAWFDSVAVDEDETCRTMARVREQTGLLVDPHTAVAIAAAWATADDADDEVATVTLATADAAKFPDAVMRATEELPALPPRLADLYEREERFSVLANDLAAVEAHVLAHLP